MRRQKWAAAPLNRLNSRERLVELVADHDAAKYRHDRNGPDPAHVGPVELASLEEIVFGDLRVALVRIAEVVAGADFASFVQPVDKGHCQDEGAVEQD